MPRRRRRRSKPMPQISAAFPRLLAFGTVFTGFVLVSLMLTRTWRLSQTKPTSDETAAHCLATLGPLARWLTPDSPAVLGPENPQDCPRWEPEPPIELASFPNPTKEDEDGAVVAAQFSEEDDETLPVGVTAPWPEIHAQAQAAKVPILMYHDILPEKEVFFDVTPEELAEHFDAIREAGMTPIDIDWLMAHLRSGRSLPAKPVLITFDDGYKGHFRYVYPLLREYGYPAVFSIYVNKMDLQPGRPGVTWEDLEIMATDPLVTIASHSISHADDLRVLEDDELWEEVVTSKQILEERLGIPIHYFTYPVGRNDERVRAVVEEAGYRAALAMDDYDERFAGQSDSLLALSRFGQSRILEVIEKAWGGPPPEVADDEFNFSTGVGRQFMDVDGVNLALITGGIPKTIHADSRYQVEEILENTEAIGAVDGGFFSLKYLDSNTMIGPVFSQSGEFIPGYWGEMSKLKNRPLVLINDEKAIFVPFDREKHNTLDGIQAELPGATDAFVGAAWLVKNRKAQSKETFGSLFDYDAYRHRAFWGINRAGQPVVGVTRARVDSVRLGKLLEEVGLRDAVMLDSGASTSLVYKGESQVRYTPRPVPHVVALYPPKPSRPGQMDPTLLVKYQFWLTDPETQTARSSTVSSIVAEQQSFRPSTTPRN
ncbi:MAG: polysaccharide deacetylase family protein [Cyanobacteria bacterium P01_H01_bin.15]